MDITGFRMSEALDSGHYHFSTFAQLSYVPAQSCFSDGYKPGNVHVLATQQNINSSSYVEMFKNGTCCNRLYLCRPRRHTGDRKFK